VENRKIGEITIVKIPESVDNANAGAVETELVALIKGGVGKLACDLADNTYVSSAGLRAFMEAYNAIEEKGGKMAIFGLSEIVYEVFDITGFTDVFPIVADEQAALAALK
jgi:anti-anti-sigma factor